MPSILDDILRLFTEHGHAAYLGEPVSQTEHALQAAFAAEQAGAGSALIAAASSTTSAICSMLAHGPNSKRRRPLPRRNRRSLAYPTLRPRRHRARAPARRGQALPVRHRARLLCPSVQCFHRQLAPSGRAFTPSEVEEFRRGPFAADAVALRRWDEQAKVAGLPTPPLEHFLSHLSAAPALIAPGGLVGGFLSCGAQPSSLSLAVSPSIFAPTTRNGSSSASRRTAESSSPPIRCCAPPASRLPSPAGPSISPSAKMVVRSSSRTCAICCPRRRVSEDPAEARRSQGRLQCRRPARPQ